MTPFSHDLPTYVALAENMSVQQDGIASEPDVENVRWSRSCRSDSQKANVRLNILVYDR
jgi:hypothetical protein